MSEFFIELFSEEIPANLQNKTRQDFFQNIKEYFEKEEIKYSADQKIVGRNEDRNART